MTTYQRIKTVQAARWTGEMTDDLLSVLNGRAYHIQTRGFTDDCDLIIRGLSIPQGDWVIRDGLTFRRQADDSFTRDYHLPPGVEPSFDEFWATYPRRVGKKTAQRAWQLALKDGVSARAILEGAENMRIYTETRTAEERHFTPHPTTWLNRGGWDDELELPTSTTDGNRERLIAAAISSQNGDTLSMKERMALAANPHALESGDE